MRRLASMACCTTLAAVLMLAPGPTRGAHPLITEDTGTQGRGKNELELGTSLSHDGGRTFELDPQASYGATDTLDLILRPSFFRLWGDAAGSAGRHVGIGSTALDLKWRFFEEGGLSLGTRAGFDLPSAQRGLGARQAGSHALIALTRNGPLWLSGNLAWTHLPRDAGPEAARRNVFRVSLAAAANVREGVRVVGDVAAAQGESRDDKGLQPVAVVGAIVKIRDGMDFDAGYQFRLRRDAPANAWLAGLTLRW